MPNVKSHEDAERDLAAVLDDPKHAKRQKPDKPDAIDEEAIGEPADWFKAGKAHHPDFEEVGDTYVRRGPDGKDLDA